jgi:hypothetical protein
VLPGRKDVPEPDVPTTLMLPHGSETMPELDVVEGVAGPGTGTIGLRP